VILPQSLQLRSNSFSVIEPLRPRPVYDLPDVNSEQTARAVKECQSIIQKGITAAAKLVRGEDLPFPEMILLTAGQGHTFDVETDLQLRREIHQAVTSRVGYWAELLHEAAQVCHETHMARSREYGARVRREQQWADEFNLPKPQPKIVKDALHLVDLVKHERDGLKIDNRNLTAEVQELQMEVSALREEISEADRRWLLAAAEIEQLAGKKRGWEEEPIDLSSPATKRKRPFKAATTRGYKTSSSSSRKGPDLTWAATQMWERQAREVQGYRTRAAERAARAELDG
jgi:hypothetical protein